MSDLPRGLRDGDAAAFDRLVRDYGDRLYRFACLVPGHEGARMWDVFKITRGGKPSVVDLRAK